MIPSLGLLVAAITLSAATPAASPAQSPSNAGHWVGTWAAAPQPAAAGHVSRYADQTLRLIVHVSLPGNRARLRLSNLFGDRPLRVGSVHLARRTTGADIDPASDRPMTFAGRTGTVIAGGALAISDPVDLEVPALSDLAVSLHLPEACEATTTHLLARQTNFVAAGDATGAVHFPVAAKLESWAFLSGVDVETSPGAAAVVAFGDSTVDGDGTSVDANARWPDVLAARLQREHRNLAVLNEGLIGNRLLRDSPRWSGNPFGAAFGPSGLRRFERDVLSQAGAKVVLLRIGLNDVALPGALAPAAEAVTAEQLIAGTCELGRRARRRGLRVVATTMTPFENANVAPGFYTPAKEPVRQRFNAWLRRSRDFDGIVDFDAVVRDPAHPARLLLRYDSGDHVHPNDAGYAAMAEAIPLKLIDPKGAP